jgi:hypothetical protein
MSSKKKILPKAKMFRGAIPVCRRKECWLEEGMEEGGGNCFHLLLIYELPHLSAAGSRRCLFLKLRIF